MQTPQRRHRSSKIATDRGSRSDVVRAAPTVRHPDDVARQNNDKSLGKSLREPLTKRLQNKGALVANDNAGRSRRGQPSPAASARPFGQKVVLYLIGFTTVLAATLVGTTMVLETPLSFAANLGFAIALACTAGCIPVVDTIAKILATSLSAALIGIFTLFSAAP